MEILVNLVGAVLAAGAIGVVLFVASLQSRRR
jgi:nitrogen fixation-related uncharacterized protein